MSGKFCACFGQVMLSRRPATKVTLTAEMGSQSVFVLFLLLPILSCVTEIKICNEDGDVKSRNCPGT